MEPCFVESIEVVSHMKTALLCLGGWGGGGRVASADWSCNLLPVGTTPQ